MYMYRARVHHHLAFDTLIDMARDFQPRVKFY